MQPNQPRCAQQSPATQINTPVRLQPPAIGWTKVLLRVCSFPLSARLFSSAPIAEHVCHATCSRLLACSMQRHDNYCHSGSVHSMLGRYCERMYRRHLRGQPRRIHCHGNLWSDVSSLLQRLARIPCKLPASPGCIATCSFPPATPVPPCPTPHTRWPHSLPRSLPCSLPSSVLYFAEYGCLRRRISHSMRDEDRF